MDRRDTIKSILVGSLAGGLLLNGCAPEEVVEEQNAEGGEGLYGRTPEELERDAELNSEQFFNEHELETIAVLCDLILPANEQFGSATDAGVPEFMEFIVKDMPSNQLPIRGGLMWLDNHSNRLFSLEFKSCSETQQRQILDSIAYPNDVEPELEAGARFFTIMRNMTLTGYYTTKMGIEDLGYQGNRPGVWDGVPEDELKRHGLAYEEEWLAKCIDQSKRTNLAQWDDDGNLIS